MLNTVAVIAACTLGAGENTQIIEFTGKSCGACRQMAPVVEQLRQAGCDIQQVDVNQRPDVAQAFGIREIPCFVILRDDRVVDRRVGTASYQQMMEFCRPAQDDPLVRGQTEPADRRGTIVDHLRERAAFGNRADADSRFGYQAPAVAASSPGLVGSPTIIAPSTKGDSPVHPDFSAEAAPRNQAPPDVATYPQPATPQASVDPGSMSMASAGRTAMANPIERALQATVRLQIDDDCGSSYGTGTVIDVHDQESLILTCGHIFRASDGKGRITCDFFAGEGVSAEGTLICYDIRRDVGLVSARPKTEVVPVRVGGNGRQPRQGDPVFSVGCNHGQAPTIIENRILAVNRYHGPANLVVGGRPVDGRSGGGLFTDDGILIGVCNAADEQQDEGLYAALGPIHAELDRAGLAFVYGPREPRLASQPRHGNSGVAPSQFLFDGSSPVANAASGSVVPSLESSPPPEAGPSAPRVYPAVGSESMTDTAHSSDELICILRSSQNGVDRSRVVVIDRPSSELVSRLSQEVNQRGPHAATDMHVPGRTDRVPDPARPNTSARWAGDWQGQGAMTR